LETLGEYLKNKRESCNITLEEVAKVTKIRKSILEAIESDRHDLLPPSVFTQGFLRNYASYVGLDEGEVVKRYQQVLEELEAERDKEKIKGRKPAKRVSSPIRITVLFIIFLIAAAILFFSLPQSERRVFTIKNSQQKKKVKSIKSLPVTKPDVLEKGGEEEHVMEEEEKELDFSDKGIEDSGLREGVEAKQMSLQVLATEITWIKFQINHDEPFEVLLRAGESFKVKAEEKFNLRIGNAGGVELFLNEKTLGKPGKRGEVVDLTLPVDPG